MDTHRLWFGWIAIGLAGAALLVALFGRGFGPQAAGMAPANAPQFYGQQADGSQPGGAPAFGPSAQQGSGQPRSGPQQGGVAPGANPQHGQRGPDSGRQNGPAGPGADARRGPGRPGDGGFGFGGWLGFPLKLLGDVSRLATLGLLALFGVWLLRRRGAVSGTPSTQPAGTAQAPAQEPLSPTGESHTEEPDDRGAS